MAYLIVSLKNGHRWTLTSSEVIVPRVSLREMSPQEIGEQMTAMASVLEEFRQYLETRHDEDYFCSLEDFRAEAAANSERLKRPATRHSSTNDTWQIDHQVYSSYDFRKMLDQDRWSKIFRPGVRLAVEAVVNHPESWQEAGRAIGLSKHTVREKVRFAVQEYRRWEAIVGARPSTETEPV